MLKRIRPRLRGNGPWILVSAIGVALVATPFAVAAGEGRPLDGGARNPSNNASQSYRRETQIIANLSTYGTRQSNKSNNGGGAIYGCRSGPGGSAANNEPCVRASNLSSGLAFEFATGGTRVGSITSTNTSAAPFTTNATGVATGLNADQVDGQSASEIAASANRFAQRQRGRRARRPARRDRREQRGRRRRRHLRRRLQRQHLGLRARRDDHGQHGGRGRHRAGRRDGRARRRQLDGQRAHPERGRRRRPTSRST